MNATTRFNINATTESVILINATSNGSSSTSPDGHPGFTTRSAEKIMVRVLIVMGVYLTVVASWYQAKLGTKGLKWVNRTCTLCAACFLVETVWFFPEVYGYLLTSSLCSAVTIIGLVQAVWNRCLVYTVLWMRQHAFNRKQSASSGSWPCVKVLSYIVLAGIVVLSIAQLAILAVQTFYHSPEGCNTLGHNETGRIIIRMVYVLYTLMQVSLLALVLYPICVHVRNNRVRGRENRIQGIIVRLCICTAICVATDVLFIAVANVRPPFPSISYIPIVFSFNVVVNISALYFSFSDYVQRFLPFVTRNKVESSSGEQDVTPV